MINSKIDQLKAEIESIKNQINSRKLSPSQVQSLNDEITERKREIEKLSRTEKMVTPIVGAPTVGEKKEEPDDRFERRNTFII